MNMHREIDEEREHMRLMDQITQEEKDALEQRPRVAEAMRRHGGGFVQALGEALSRADSNNTRRIRKAFPEYWMEYLEWATSDSMQGAVREEDK